MRHTAPAYTHTEPTGFKIVLNVEGSGLSMWFGTVLLACVCVCVCVCVPPGMHNLKFQFEFSLA